MKQDNSFLGEAKISKILLKFSLPCVASLLISALYNIVDQIFIGNSSLGYLGNAATGIVFPILIITQAFAWWIGDGCASFLAICQGKKDNERSHKSIGNGIILNLLISIILMIFALIPNFRESLLRLFGASDNTISLASTYLKIVASFFPIYMFVNMLSPIIRSDGSPMYSMICVGSGAVANIILDPIMIYGLKMGIAGAAWATVIGQIISGILTFLYLFKSKSFKLIFKSFIPNFKIFKNAIILGISSFITQASIVVVALVCNMMLSKYGAMSKYGVDIPISVISVETKVFTVLVNIIVGIILGGQPIIGYNIGAGNTKRVKETYKLVLRCSIIITLLFTIINEIYPQAFILPFGNGGELYMEFAVYTFRIFLSLTSFTCLIKMTSIFFQAVGKPLSATICSLFRDIIFLIPLVCILPIVFESHKTGSGVIGILYAAPISDFIAMIIAVVLTIVYFKGLDKKQAKEEFSTAAILPSKPGVIITIAREHGTQGKIIGKLIAEKLNIPFYCKDIISLAAEKEGLDANYVANMSKVSTITDNLYLTKNVEATAITAQREIIEKIAANGSCVIVGRAADYILKDKYEIINVFFYSDMETRINNIMNMYQDTREDAIKYIKQSDATRANYYKTITGEKWGNKHLYDLCINTKLGAEQAAGAVLHYLKK